MTGVPLLTMRVLSKLHSARLLVPVVGDKPHHPIDFAFPPEDLARRIQPSIAFKLDGLNSGSGSITMKTENNSASCFYCIKAYKENKLNNIPIGNLEKIP